MATKAKAGDKVNLKDWEELDSLIVVDVNKHMRLNDAGDLEENEEMENIFYNRKQPKFKRKVLSTEINGEEMVVTSLFKLMEMFKLYGLRHSWVFVFEQWDELMDRVNKNYKGNRVNMGHYYYDQVNTARKLLEEAGFTVLSNGARSAKSTISEVVKQNYDYYDKIGIFSSNTDLSYLVDDKVSWLNVKKSYADIHMDNYFQQNKCPYNSVLLKKALVGNRGENIKGAQGVGEKKFFKFLEHEGIFGEDVRGRERDIIRNTTFLTDIQKEQALSCWNVIAPKELNIDATAGDSFDVDVLRLVFKKYNFKSLLKALEKEIVSI